MARGSISVQAAVRAGLAPAMTTCDKTDGNKFSNDGHTVVLLVAGASAPTLTFQTPGSVDGMAVADRTVSTTAAVARKVIGPFPPSQYNQGDDEVYMDCDVGNAIVAIIRV